MRAFEVNAVLVLLGRTAIVTVAIVLWFSGLRLFLDSPISGLRRKTWAAILIAVGVGVGAYLPLGDLWRKFCMLLLLLPLLGLADVFLFRSRRTFSFWIRACGFEVCTVFASAAATRMVLNLANLLRT